MDKKLDAVPVAFDAFNEPGGNVLRVLEEMRRALWACQVFLIDDEIYAQTAELRRTVEKALRRAEGIL
jgi:hypothetical protein